MRTADFLLLGGSDECFGKTRLIGRDHFQETGSGRLEHFCQIGIKEEVLLTKADELFFQFLQFFVLTHGSIKMVGRFPVKEQAMDQNSRKLRLKESPCAQSYGSIPPFQES